MNKIKNMKKGSRDFSGVIRPDNQKIETLKEKALNSLNWYIDVFDHPIDFSLSTLKNDRGNVAKRGIAWLTWKEGDILISSDGTKVEFSSFNNTESMFDGWDIDGNSGLSSCWIISKFTKSKESE